MDRPGALVAGFGSLWVQDRADGSIWRIDGHGKVVAKIPEVVATGSIGQWPALFAVGLGSIWSLRRGEVVRIDPATNEPTATIAVPTYSNAIGLSPEGVWVQCCSGGLPRLLLIDPSTNAAHEVTKEAVSPSAFAVGNGSVWWGNFSEAASVSRMDIATLQKTYISTQVRAQFIVPTPDWVWLIDGGMAQRLPPDVTSHAPITKAVRKAQGSIGATYANGIVWLNGDIVVGFDATTGKVTTTIAMPGTQDPQTTAGIAVLGKYLWVVDPAMARVVRLAL